MSNCANWITVVLLAMQWWVFNKQRKDNLFKLREENYCELLSFFKKVPELSKRYDDNINHFLLDKEAFVKEIGVTRLLSKTEYLFDASLVRYFRDNLNNGLFYELGEINHESGNFEFNDKTENRFAPFFKT